MHYKNGREAKPGDVIVRPGDSYNPTISGVLHSVNVQSTTCNGRVAPQGQNDPYVTLSECLHIDDIKAASVPNSADLDRV